MKTLIFLVGFLSIGVTHAQAAAAPTDLRIFVEVIVNPGADSEFRMDLLSIVASTRKEPGNLDYAVYQSPTDPTDFMVYEHWLSAADHNNHVNSQAFHDYQTKTTPLIATITHKPMFDLDHTN